MRALINSVDRLLFLMKNDEHYTFNYEMLEFLRPRAALIPPVASLMGSYEDAFREEDTAYKLSLKSALTDRIEKLDNERDNLFILLKEQTAAASRSSVVARKRAGEALSQVVSAYIHANRLSLTEETSQIINCLQDLRQDENRPHVTLLALDADVDRLEAVNTELDTLYLQRSYEMGLDSDKGNLQELRGVTDQRLTAIFRIINALYEVNPVTGNDPVLEENLKDAIAGINGAIEKAKDVYYRRVEAAKPHTDSQQAATGAETGGGGGGIDPYLYLAASNQEIKSTDGMPENRKMMFRLADRATFQSVVAPVAVGAVLRMLNSKDEWKEFKVFAVMDDDVDKQPAGLIIDRPSPDSRYVYPFIGMTDGIAAAEIIVAGHIIAKVTALKFPAINVI